jgi:hypothetical protein
MSGFSGKRISAWLFLIASFPLSVKPLLIYSGGNPNVSFNISDNCTALLVFIIEKMFLQKSTLSDEEIPEIIIVVLYFNEDKNMDKLFRKVSRVFKKKSEPAFKLFLLMMGYRFNLGSSTAWQMPIRRQRNTFTRNFGHQ